MVRVQVNDISPFCQAARLSRGYQEASLIPNSELGDLGVVGELLCQRVNARVSREDNSELALSGQSARQALDV
jgi:hypothetical protein